MKNEKSAKVWVATIVAGSLVAGEMAHEAILPHAEIGHQDGNNVPRELVVRVATTSDPVMFNQFLRPL